MTEHLPECAVAAARPGTFLSCICDELRACEQRMLDDDVPAAAYHGQRGYETGYAAALDAAEKTIIAIPAEYKVRGDYNSYGSYAEGKADLKDLALSAIDALRKEQR
jgi:hypothetical protein